MMRILHIETQADDFIELELLETETRDGEDIASDIRIVLGSLCGIGCVKVWVDQ